MNHEAYTRFSIHPRLQHILLFVSFAVLALTGLPQKFHNTEWAQWAVNAMGGIEFVRLIHRGAALAMGVATLYHLVYVGYILAKKGPRAWLPIFPSLKDFRDVLQMVLYFFGLRKEKPRFDQFAYYEKFDYWAVFWGMAIMGGSGLTMWFPTLVTQWLPGIIVPIAKSAHSDEAILAVLAIVLWHLYNVHFKPGIFPFNPTIFTGKISKEHIMEEHALEYARLAGVKPEQVAADFAVRRPWGVVALSGLVGTLVILGIGSLFYIGYQSKVPAVPPAPTRAPIVIRMAPTETPSRPTITVTPLPGATASPTGAVATATPTGVLAAAKPLPADHEGRTTCLACHATLPKPALPADHAGRSDTTCTACHKVSTTPTASPAAPTATAAPTGATGAGVAKPLPANHAGRTTCNVCHAAGVGPESPADHAGREDATCTACHKAP